MINKNEYAHHCTSYLRNENKLLKNIHFLNILLSNECKKNNEYTFLPKDLNSRFMQTIKLASHVKILK